MSGIFRLDLHNHTPHVASDYRTPDATAADIVDAAMAAGIGVLGVTDHFSIGFCRQAVAAAAQRANGRTLLVLPGVEMKIRHDGDEAHMVALFDPDSEYEAAFGELMSRLAVPVESLHGWMLPGLTIAADPVDVASAVESLGGMCHVGHADRTFGEYSLLGSALLSRLCASASVTAVEVLDLASRDAQDALRGATLIRSSDSHCPSEIGRRYVEIALPELSFAGVRAGLRAPQSARNAS